MTEYRSDQWVEDFTAIDVNDLWDIRDAARALNVTESAVSRWYERRASTGFPEPLRRFGRVGVWHRTDILAWHDTWKATRRGRDR